MATLVTERWIGTTGAPWSSQWISTHASGVGAATIQSGSGQILTSGSVQYGTERVFLQGMGFATDTNVYATFDSTNQAECYCALGINMDDSAYAGDIAFGNNGYFIAWSYASTAANGGLQFMKMRNGVQTALLNNTTRTFTAGVAYRVRLNRTGNVVQFKIWSGSAVEPTAWTFSTTDATNPVNPGKVGMILQSGAANAAQSMNFYDLVVTDDSTLSLPYTTYPFTSTSGVLWSTEWSSPNGSAIITISSGGIGRIQSGAATALVGGYTALDDLDPDTDGTEMTGTVRMAQTGVEQYAYIHLNGSGTNTSTTLYGPQNGYQVRLVYTASTTVFIELYIVVANATTYLASSSPISVAATTAIGFRARRSSLGSFTAKIWNTAGAEPAAWSVTYQLTQPLMTGYVALGVANGSAATARSAIYDDVAVTIANDFVSAWIGV